MFKSLRSSLFWYYLYKFRKRFVIITILLFIILLSGFIYSDIVQYLTLRHKLNYLDYILPIKWLVIFTNIAIIAYLIFSLFKKDDIQPQQKENKDKKIDNTKNLKELTEREKSFLHTKKLKTQADIIINKSQSK